MSPVDMDDADDSNASISSPRLTKAVNEVELVEEFVRGAVQSYDMCLRDLHSPNGEEDPEKAFQIGPALSSNNGFGLVEVPVVLGEGPIMKVPITLINSRAVTSCEELGHVAPASNLIRVKGGDHQEANKPQGLRGGLKKLNWWMHISKGGSKATTKPKRDKSKKMMGARSVQYQNLTPHLSIESIMKNINRAHDCVTEAIETLKVGNQLGVEFNAPEEEVIGRFVAIEQAEEC
ncbi:hypothetical protein V6N13_081215 [Hibiscus sabdariffa]